jgi:hypothetical protein
MTMQKFEESINCCQQAIKKHAGDNDLKQFMLTMEVLGRVKKDG